MVQNINIEQKQNNGGNAKNGQNKETKFKPIILDEILNKDLNNKFKENKDYGANEVLKALAEEWNSLPDKKKEKYEEKSEKDRERFKKQNVEFKEFGYYTKSREQKEEEKEKKSQSQKKRSQKKSQSQKKSAKK